MNAGTNGVDGGSSGGGGEGGSSDAQLSPFLRLEAQPLTLVAGANDVLQIKVLERRDVGDVSFRVTLLPEGVSGPSVVTLAANADVINIALTSVASARHGDFTVKVAADGIPFEAAAKLVVRGTPGSKDTGFGTDGSAIVPITPSGTLYMAGLSDDRIVLGFTQGGKPSLHVVDAVGKYVATPIAVTQTGTLSGLVATPDGGFTTLVEAADGKRIVWFSNAGVQVGNLLVSTKTTPAAQIASTPVGTLFAQVQKPASDSAMVVERYLVGVADTAFPRAEHVTEGPNLHRLVGSADGSAWVMMQSGVSQDQVNKFQANKAPNVNSLPPTFSCIDGAALGDDLVCYYGEDAPPKKLRRLTPAGTSVATFGTAGALPLSIKAFDRLLAQGDDRLFLSHYETSGDTNTLKVIAYDGKAAVRTVFGTAGVLSVTGTEGRPSFALEPRGRLLFVAPEFTGSTTELRLHRFWN